MIIVLQDDWMASASRGGLNGIRMIPKIGKIHRSRRLDPSRPQAEARRKSKKVFNFLNIGLSDPFVPVSPCIFR